MGCKKKKKKKILSNSHKNKSKIATRVGGANSKGFGTKLISLNPGSEIKLPQTNNLVTSEPLSQMKHITYIS